MFRIALSAAALLLVGTSCTKYPYVALLEGTWVGTATDAQGVAAPMLATFEYDAEKEQYKLSGTIDMDGWIYTVESASSDKESATVDYYNPLGVRDLKLKGLIVEEETALSGKYDEDQCFGQGQPCLISGSITAALQ